MAHPPAYALYFLVSLTYSDSFFLSPRIAVEFGGGLWGVVDEVN